MRIWRDPLIKKIILVGLLSFAVMNEANALSTCDSILQQGIFDRHSQLSENKKHDVIKRSWCRTNEKARGGGVGLKIKKIFNFNGKGNKKNINKYCQSSFKNLMSDTAFLKITREASHVIVNAWSSCIKQNIGKLSHSISPSKDPSKFIYHIKFTSPNDGLKEVKLLDWQVDNAICPNNLKGSVINTAGRKMICKRNPKQVVTIVAGAKYYSSNTKEVELDAYRDSSCGLFFKRAGGQFTEDYIDLNYHKGTNPKLTLKLESVTGNKNQGKFSGWLWKPYTGNSENGGWKVEGSYHGTRYNVTHTFSKKGQKKYSLVTGGGTCDYYGAIGNKAYIQGHSKHPKYSVAIY